MGSFFTVLSLIISISLSAQQIVPGQLVFKLKPEFAQNREITEFPAELQEQIDHFQMEVELVFPLSTEMENVSIKFHPSLYYYASFSGNYSPLKVAQHLNKVNSVEYAEPRFIGELAYNTNDPKVSNQLYLTTINAFKAWDISKGNSNVIIGLLDAGVDTSHVDIKPNIYKNASDPINGLDDDGDGYTDNYLGWDFGTNSNNVQYTSADHGVQMFGAISPATDNNVGISGVAFNCPVMPIKVTTGGQVTHGFEAIKYAADKGCKVINCSWNFSTYSKFGEDMVNYATLVKGALVVAATGNQTSDYANYPAGYANCLSVASLDYQNNALSNSNRGYFVKMGAVGINIYTLKPNNQYGTNTGTSFSSSIISGAAALLLSHRSSLTPLEARATLMASSRDIYQGGRNGAYKNLVGKGAPDVEQALLYGGAAYIEVVDISLSDNDGTITSGDTVNVVGKFTNFLSNSGNVNLYVKALDGYGFIETSPVSLGVVNKNDTVSNTANPLKIILGGGIPPNYAVKFELGIIESGDTITHGFEVLTNPTFVELNENNISTVFGNRGTFGWYLYPQQNGLGVRYKNGSQLLYEGGFLLASGTEANSTVMDRIRGIRDVEQKDFETTKATTATPPYKASTLSVAGQFSDSGSVSRIGVRVNQRAHVWRQDSRANFVLLEYEVSSHNGSTLSNIYGGLLADWDIEDFERNKAEYDGQRYLAYTYSGEGKGEYCGIQLISPEKHWRTYAIDHIAGGAGGIDLTDNDVFSKAEKFEALSNTREKAGEASAEGNDVLQLISSGPHQISSDSSLTFVYAIHVAPSLSELKKSADTAFYLYHQRIPDGLKESTISQGIQLYPNPTRDVLNLKYDFDEELFLEIMDLKGQVKLFISGPVNQLPVSEFPEGYYLLRWKSKSRSGIEKFIILRD